MTLGLSMSWLPRQMNNRVGRAQAQTVCLVKTYLKTEVSMRLPKLRNSRLWMTRDKNRKLALLATQPSVRRMRPLQMVFKGQPTKRRRRRASLKGPPRNRPATNSLPRLSLIFQRQSGQANIRTVGARGCNNNNNQSPTPRTQHLLGPVMRFLSSIKRTWLAWTSWEP
jgi:hypothetical protein